MTDTSIAFIHARRVWDSRGRPTVEADVLLEGGAVGRAIAPAGASTGSAEAVDLRDGGPAFGGYDVTKAVAHVNGIIAHAVVGMDAVDQEALDERLIELDGTRNKGRLGANATLSVSMAAAHAAAAAAGQPLYRYLGGPDAALIPLPQIQIFGGGAHAVRRVDIQDFMVMCPAAASFGQALDWTAEVYRAAGLIMAEAGNRAGVADEGGWWPMFATNEEALDTLVRAIERAGFRPGEQVGIALDVAASEFGRNGTYKMALDKAELTSDGMIELLTGWIGRYPILSIEDPLAEDDLDGLVAFTRAVGDRIQIVGDDLFVTDADRLRDAAAREGGNCVLLKPNQRGTLTEALDARRAAQDVGYATIVSARSGETEDITIAHLAVGWGAGQLKVGSFSRGERMAKWNEVLRIEEALGGKARFAGGTVLRRSGADRAAAEGSAGPQ
jgi:enolase